MYLPCLTLSRLSSQDGDVGQQAKGAGEELANEFAPGWPLAAKSPYGDWDGS